MFVFGTGLNRTLSAGSGSGPRPPNCYYYYFPSLTFFHLFISSFTDAPYASLFVSVYTFMHLTQSPNIAFLSCLLRNLGIVIHTCSIYQLLTSDSSCLISCRSRTQHCCIVQLPYTDVPRNRLWVPASRRVTNINSNHNV
jgi:hypothetical protein